MRRREVAGFLHLDMQSADVPTHEVIRLHFICEGGKCFLDMRRKQDTYSIQLTSADDGALAKVMNEIVEFAFSPAR